MDKREEFLHKCRTDFLIFCKAMFKEDEFDFANHHRFLCNTINTKISSGNKVRLALSMPPGHGKSTLLSVLLSAFLIGQDPKNKVILISHSGPFADSLGRKCRALMNRPIYQTIFPETIISSKGESGTFETSDGGGLQSVGRGGQIIGKRANFILIDDVLKNKEEADSPAIIRKLWEWFPTVPMTRLLPNAGIIILSTRWCKKDLIGFVTKKGKGAKRWEYINLEGICTDKEKDPLGREVGEPLWPEWYDLDYYEEVREDEAVFQTVFQGNPTSEVNTTINIGNITYYRELRDEQTEDFTVLSYDTASKVGDYTDYTAITVWGVRKDLRHAHLKTIIRKKLEFPDLCETFEQLDRTYQPDYTIIENASSGIQLLQVKNSTPGLERAFIKPTQKIPLSETFDYMLNKGEIIFYNSIRKLKDCLTDLNEFPYGLHDDVSISCLLFVQWMNSVDPSKLVKRNAMSSTSWEEFDFLAKKFNKRVRSQRNSLDKIKFGKGYKYNNRALRR